MYTPSTKVFLFIKRTLPVNAIWVTGMILLFAVTWLRSDGQDNKNAGSIHIRGRVFDTKEPPNPLPGVIVRVKGKPGGTTTDATGNFGVFAKKETRSFSPIPATSRLSTGSITPMKTYRCPWKIM